MKRTSKKITISSLPKKTAIPDFNHRFNQARQLMCVIGNNGYLRRMNPAWGRTLGWESSDLLASKLLDVVHWQDRDRTWSSLSQTNYSSNTFECRLRHKNGTFHNFEWTVYSAHDDDKIYAIADEVVKKLYTQEDLLAAVEHERQRLSLELHDGICQEIAGISALSCALSRELGAAPHSRALDAFEISQLLNKTIEQIRDIARGLSPHLCMERGLITALGALTQSVEKQFSILCDLKCENRVTGLTTKVKTNLYRIAQEALSNAIIHGHAKAIHVYVGMEKGNGVLKVLDDGSGMLDDHQPLQGSGLRNMTHRANLIGASLRVTPRNHHGTVVTCRFPVTHVL